MPALPATAQCGRPVALPGEGLTRAQVEQLWARDRASLVKCGYSLEALTSFYDDLRQRLAAANLR